MLGVMAEKQIRCTFNAIVSRYIVTHSIENGALPPHTVALALVHLFAHGFLDPQLESQSGRRGHLTWTSPSYELLRLKRDVQYPNGLRVWVEAGAARR